MQFGVISIVPSKFNAMLKNYFRIATRILARNRLYTTINILGLALGICGCMIIWLVGSYEMSFDRFHPDGDRIYRVGGGGKPGEQKMAEVLPPMPDAIRKMIPGMESVTAFFPLYNGQEVLIPAGDKPAGSYDEAAEGQDGMPGVIIADADYFSIFRYQWLAGNPAVALQQPFTVVLTESRARLYFGSLPPESVIGKEVIYQDSLRVHVSGVVRDWAEHTDLPYTDFISFPTIAGSFLKKVRHIDDWVLHRGGGMFYWPTCFVKLAKGVSAVQVDAQLSVLAAQHVAGSNLKDPPLLHLQPLADIHFNTDYNDNLRKAHLPTLYALTGIALFILLLAAVNFINLSTAQSLQRAKEIGVRKVLGSGKRSLVMQFLTEAGLLTATAVIIAALLTKPAMALFRDYIPPGVRFIPLAPGNLLFLVGITAGVTLLAGFYPARVLSGYQPVQTLKGSGSVKGGEKWWLRRGLIVFQFTISLVFIIVTLVIGNQIRFMLNTDYGFKTDAIVSVGGEWNDTTGKIKVLEQRFSQIPGIAQMVREEDPPAGWGRTTMGVTYKGKTIVNMGSTVEWADEGYIPFYGMRMLAGRNIRHTDSLAEFVINETAAKQLGFAQPAAAIGQFLYVQNKPYPIVGVVDDFHEGSFREAIQSAVIGNMPREENMLGVRLASAGKGADNMKATLDAMKKAYKEVFPTESFNPWFMDELIREMYEEEQKTASLVRVAMGLAIFISCMGLFGLSLFTAERCAGEIGIRKVLGATTGDIALMLNRQFIRLVLLAMVIASPIAWILAHRWLQDFAYRVTVNGWVFILAGLGAVGIALVTVSYQSIRAAAANPVKSLKAE
jgi:ABC-type antimicrobial peptide transport system permease subunit